MSDIVNRLREFVAIDGGDISDVEQAADYIEHLERVLAQARGALKDSDVRVYELCSTSSVPEPAATRARTAKAIAAIDEALKS